MTERREESWAGEVLPGLRRQSRWYDAAAFGWLLVATLLVLALLLGAAVQCHAIPTFDATEAGTTVE
jgi:hypothetical protein